jgi:hypothetical protein
MFRFAVLAALMCGFLWLSPAVAEPVFVPGSRVGLVPPVGFVPSDKFKGFLSAAERGSILIVEMPKEAYAQVSRLSDAGLADRGIKVHSRSALTVGKAPAVLIRGQQSYSGIVLTKWLMVIGFADFAAMVTAQMPADLPSFRLDAMDQSLKTIAYRPALTMAQKMAALPFSLGSTADMRVVNVMAGNTLILTRGPKDTFRGAEQPLLVITRSFTGPGLADAKAEKVARLTIRNIASLSDISIERTRTASFAGGDGFEIVARARATRTRKPVAVIQWVKMLDEAYVRMVGIASPKSRETDFTAFREIRDGIRAK